MVNLLRFVLAMFCLVALVGCGAPMVSAGGGYGVLPENIDGTYLIHSMNYQSEIRLPDEVAERMRKEARTVVFDAGKMTMHLHGTTQTYDITIDRTKSPPQISFTRELQGKPDTTYGVITMINDQLTVCQNMSSQKLKPEERPTDIVNGVGIVTVKLKKES